MSFRSLFVLALAGLAFCGNAHATEPSPAEVLSAEQLFGFDLVVDASAAHYIESDKSFAALSPAARDCWKAELHATLQPQFDQAFVKVFASSEIISAWLDFAKTPGGEKFTGYLRGGVQTIATGGQPPSLEEFRASISDEEFSAIQAFLGTEPGQVLQKLSGLDQVMTDADMAAASDRISTKCGAPKAGAN